MHRIQRRLSLRGRSLNTYYKNRSRDNHKTNSSSINVRPYHLPEKHKIEVNRQIKEMLEQEIIRPSISQWNAPLLIVLKKTDASGKPKLRVKDFRKLNDLTIGDSFPIPNITDILD